MKWGVALCVHRFGELTSFKGLLRFVHFFRVTILISNIFMAIMALSMHTLI